MDILFKECNNKLIAIYNNGITYLFSYESLIAIIYNDYLILNSFYKNYSNTTNKHIAFIKNYFRLYDIIELNYNTFKELRSNDFKTDSLEKLIKYTKESYYIKEYIKELKISINSKEYNIKNFYDSYINLRHHIELIKGSDALRLEKDQIKELKTVTKHYLTYKVNNIEFIIIKTYSNNKNKTLKNIKISNIKELSI